MNNSKHQVTNDTYSEGVRDMNETLKRIKELCEKVERKEMSEEYATHLIKKLIKSS